MKTIFIVIWIFICGHLSMAQPGFNKAEYFFNTDPGVGFATPLTIPAVVSDTVSFISTISVSSLPAGFHFLGLRVQHNDGKWGLFEKRGFYITNASANAADITAAEYFFNTDPGVGNAVPLPVGTSGSTVTFTTGIPTTLPPGFHFLAIRVKGSDGVWGLFEKRGFYISSSTSNAADITAAEYFLNTDPGVGNGTPINIGAGGPDLNFTAVIPTSLPIGFHFLSIRVKGSDGIWGLFEKRGFYISSATFNAADIVAAEYFFNTDPGVGNGTAIPIGTSGSTVTLTAVIPATLPVGFHFLSIRTKGSDGIWGLFEKRGFYISQATTDMPHLTNAEYFFDTDPGVGNATQLTVATAGNTVSQTFNIPVPGNMAQGPHYLALRARDQSGNWSLFEFRQFTVAGVVPVTGLMFNAVKDGNHVKLDWNTQAEINAMHYAIERSIDGLLYHRIGEIQATGNSYSRSSYAFTDQAPAKGINYYRIKQIDNDDRFVYSDIRIIRFDGAQRYRVYPVITRGDLQVTGITNPVNIKLFNAGGQLMKTVSTANASLKMNISNFTSGTYWLVIEKKGSLEFVQKVIRQ